jgi:hypothetical protein
MLRAFLAEHDEPCPVCGYNLRGLTGEACPECQQRLVLRVGPAAPDLVSFALAVVGLSACGVLAAFHLGTLLVVAVLEGEWPSRRESFLLIVWPAVTLVVDGVLVWLLLRRRGRVWFRSRASDKRALLAAGCWASSVAVFVSWIWGMFAM